MNSSLKQQLLEICNRFKTEQLIEAIKTHFPDEKTWEQTTFDIYTISDLSHIIPRIFNQLKAVAESDDYHAYPWVHNNNVYGSSDLGTMLNQLLSFITEKKQVGEFLGSVNWLLKYLFEYGLWNKPHSNSRSYNFEEKITDLQILEERLKQEIVRLIEIQSTWHNEKSQIESEKGALSQFLEQKKEELRLISETLTTVTNQKNEIDNTFKNIGQSDADIRAIHKNQLDLFEQIKQQKENQEKDYKANSDRLIDDDKRFNEIIDSGNQKIEYFNSLKEFIENKQKEIVKLTGLAADGSLGHTFNTRKEDLKKPVNFWKWAMPIMTGLTVVWVVCVFTQFFTTLPNSFDWNLVLVNIVKTIPMFILLGFTVNQYTKERNLQEEYAFKAAVAMTITAYSDKISDVKTKEQLIIDAVNKVYVAPKIQSEKSGSVFSFSTKKLNETLSSLTEAVKQIKK